MLAGTRGQSSGGNRSRSPAMGYRGRFAIPFGGSDPGIRALELRNIDDEYSARRTRVDNPAGPTSTQHQHAVVLLLARPPGTPTFQARLARSDRPSGDMGAGCPGGHAKDPPDRDVRYFVCWIRIDVIRLSTKPVWLGAGSLQDRAFRAAETVACRISRAALRAGQHRTVSVGRGYRAGRGDRNRGADSCKRNRCRLPRADQRDRLIALEQIEQAAQCLAAVALQFRIVLHDAQRLVTRLRNELAMHVGARDAIAGQAALSYAEHVAFAAQFQVFLGNPEAIGGFPDDLEACFRHLVQRLL